MTGMPHWQLEVRRIEAVVAVVAETIPGQEQVQGRDDWDAVLAAGGEAG